jgi:uroporphyrin-III C-methyltransferase/precorrin-2 dehydrogenase/sirohydrochlorin ferrochelatase
VTSLFGLDLQDKRVLVAGGGTVATRRLRRFLSDGAQVVVVAPEASEDIERLASHGDIEWHRRPVEPADLDGAWFVLLATDDADVNEALSARAAQMRVWCINASKATLGTARAAATSIHGDLAVGVVSLGAPDPVRVRAVRDAIAEVVDGGSVDLRRHRAGSGRVILVGSGPGDAGMLTIRGRQALAEADVVVTDRLGSSSILSTLPYDVEVINVGKSPDNHPVPQIEINRILVERASEGKTVVRLKGGDPFIFGRGGEEINACLSAGIDYEVVPGVTSALSVPAAAGISVTQRGVAASVLITTGHAGAERAAIASMLAGATVVVLMGVSALPDIAQAAISAGVDEGTPVAIVESGTTTHQRVTRGDLGSIAALASETGVKSPAVIVIGEVARPELLASSVSATPQ